MTCKLVFTETASYYIDLECMLVTRTPGNGLGKHPQAVIDPIIENLRKDNEAVKLIKLVQCEVDKPMQMVVSLREDNVPTVRQTTFVRHITDAKHVDHSIIITEDEKALEGKKREDTTS